MEEEQQVMQASERQESDGWDAARERFDGDDDPLAAPAETEPQAEAQRPEADTEQLPEQPAPTQEPVDWEARYRAAEAERESLRRQLEQRESAGQSEPRAEPPREEKAPVPIPDDMKEEARAFSQQYPDLVGLLTEDSAAGRLIRKKLSEYGTDEAASYAIPIGESRRAAQASQRTAQDVGRQAAEMQVRQYWGAVEQAHPDVVRAIRNGQGDRLVEELRAWARTKPYEEGRALLETLERSGDIQGTCGLLARWKEDMQAAQAAQPTQSQRRDIARSMAAVPSRSGHIPPTQAIPSEDSGWGDAKRRWG